MSVQASHVALPNLGTLTVLSSLVDCGDSEIFDNPTLTCVLDVMWENHIKNIFLMKASFFTIMSVLWIALVQNVMSHAVTDDITLSIRANYGSLAIFNFYFIYQEYRQSKGNPAGVFAHFLDFWYASPNPNSFSHAFFPRFAPPPPP
jgi:hypothetical protein